jgi:hypothetical protein
VRTAVRTVTIAAPAAPGLYFWARGSETIGAVGVQLGAGEPQLARATTAELTSRFGGADRAIVSSDVTAFLGSVKQSGASQPLAVPLLWLALLAVLAEAWLSGRFRSGASAKLDSSARAA